jgi:hypothetical protein
LAGAGVLIAFWPGLPGRPASADSLSGQLVVIVRPPERASEPRPIEEAGTLPVRADGAMSLQVQLDPPAYAYLVWLDSEGQVVPLYPWNHDSLEGRDVNQPPPARRPTGVLVNPPIGGGLKFGKRGGMETVLLLARRTPLAADVRLGPLIGTVPPPRMRHRDELVVLRLDPGADAISTLVERNRGPEACGP